MILRSEWGAKKPRHGYTEHIPNTITIHHSVSPKYTLIKDIQKWHRDDRGWNDIGYHYVINGDGEVFEGRPEWAVGAHVSKHNTGNIGICILGNYAIERPNDESIEALKDLLIDLCINYNIDPLTGIKGHKDYKDNNTSCPEKNLYSMLDSIREEIKERIS